MYETAIQAGATGGKLLGAGGGGFFLFYVENERKESFAKKMDRYIEIPFKFENEGTKIIHYG
jgi:D-glycero-alpha-D-manno-heptose-7-phosphate kinase